MMQGILETAQCFLKGKSKLDVDELMERSHGKVVELKF